MRRNLTKTGNSLALVLTRDMREHLGITDAVEVVFGREQIVLKKPMSVEEASVASDRKFAKAYKRLAK